MGSSNGIDKWVRILKIWRMWWTPYYIIDCLFQIKFWRTKPYFKSEPYKRILCLIQKHDSCDSGSGRSGHGRLWRHRRTSSNAFSRSKSEELNYSSTLNIMNWSRNGIAVSPDPADLEDMGDYLRTLSLKEDKSYRNTNISSKSERETQIKLKTFFYL